MLCKLLVFCAWTTIVSVWIDADTTTWGEDTRHLYIFRIHEADKVFHDDIDAILMEVAMITEREEIECPVIGQREVNSGQLKSTQ